MGGDKPTGSRVHVKLRTVGETLTYSNEVETNSLMGRHLGPHFFFLTNKNWVRRSRNTMKQQRDGAIAVPSFFFFFWLPDLGGTPWGFQGA